MPGAPAWNGPEPFADAVEQARAGLGDSLHYIRAGANGMADIHAQPATGIELPHYVQHRLRSGEILVFRAVIVDRDADVVFLDQRGDLCFRGHIDFHKMDDR